MDLVLQAAQRGGPPPSESASRDVESPFLVPRLGRSSRAVDPAEPAVERGEAHHVVGGPARRCRAEGTRRPGPRRQSPGPPGCERHAGDGRGQRGTEEGAAGTDDYWALTRLDWERMDGIGHGDFTRPADDCAGCPGRKNSTLQCAN